jgi:hypothetical protein
VRIAGDLPVQKLSVFLGKNLKAEGGAGTCTKAARTARNGIIFSTPAAGPETYGMMSLALIVMPALRVFVPSQNTKTWMAGTSPAMTNCWSDLKVIRR